MMNQDPFRDRSLEISLFGGLASLKLGRGDPVGRLNDGGIRERRQLTDPSDIQLRELSDLVEMLENGHITQDEFVSLKRRLFRS